MNEGEFRIEFPKFVSCTFEPKPDITAYELAQLMPYFIGRHLREDDWNLLGNATRHLKRYTGDEQP